MLVVNAMLAGFLSVVMSVRSAVAAVRGSDSQPEARHGARQGHGE